MTTFEAAAKWGVNRKRVSVLLKQGRVPGAKKVRTPQGWKWVIPNSAPKPSSLPPGRPAKRSD